MMAWNLALTEDEAERRQLVSDFVAALPDDSDTQADFVSTLEAMVRRHQQMFPEMHRRS
jgi:hypothetical protein